MSVPPGRYRHYKGNEYTVIGVAKHSETGEELVFDLYAVAYRGFGNGVFDGIGAAERLLREVAGEA